MALTSGSRLGPYEIVAPLGAGGMGEVYRARDTRLERTVAIKILPEALAGDPQFRERFDREARAISQLDHPHICALYDVGDENGMAFLVMQHLEGETLADRLAKGALSLDHALRIGIEIAGALAAAHRAGIVHRDLKPGNVMLTKAGAKLLDFGLAKASAPAAAGGLSMAPTTPPNLTQQGTILGTFQYMAPEQLEGQEADARTDIFAFGAVLYEMLTGRRAFEGKSQASLIGAIIHSEPAAVSTLQTMAPTSLDQIVRTCLAKSPDDRWQTAVDVERQLKWIAAAPQHRADSAPVGALPVGAAARVVSTRVRAARIGSLVAVVAAAVVAGWFFRGSATAPLRSPTRFELVVPSTDSPASIAVSPDGRQIAYVATTEGQSRLWVRRLDQTAARSLAGTEGASAPFWAPDAHALGFFADAKLKTVDLTGGAPQVLAEAPNGRGGSWSTEDVIVFAPSNGGTIRTAGLARVLASGGTPAVATRLADGEGHHRWPQFLPDGRRFIFFSALGRPDTHGVYLASLDGGDPVRILATEMPGVFVPPDRLLVIRGEVLMAARLDLAKGVLDGELVPVAQPVGRDEGVVAGAVSASRGTVAYRATGGSQRRQLVWMDRKGTPLGSVGSADLASNGGLALDPSGSRVAVYYPVLGNFDIWLVDTNREVPARFTFEPTLECCPVWSPDGSRLAFVSRQRGPTSMYHKLADGSGDAQLLSAEGGIPLSWTPDGRFLLYSQNAGENTGADLWVMPLSGDGKPMPVVETALDQPGGEFSPDGRWLAYESNESGRFEVYVQPFPKASGKWQLSNAGGRQPRWSRDGKELYYVALDSRLMAVATAASADGKTLDYGGPVALFPTRLASGPNHNPGRPEYAVAPDGRFLLNTVVEDTAPSPITVVVDWEAGL